MEDLFKAVRAVCSTRTWSEGIELVRGRAVVAASATADLADPEEVTVRVRVPGRAIAPTVNLYPEDEEWDCDCGSTAPACEHVAAAAIAVRRACKEGQPLSVSGTSQLALRYQLAAEADRMVCRRLLVSSDGATRELEGTLSAMVAEGARRGGAAVTPSQADLSIDRILDARRLRVLPLDMFTNLLPLLADTADVRLDEQPVCASGEPVLPRAVVEDAPRGGYRLRIEADPAVQDVVIPGIARCAPFAAEAAAAGEVDGPSTLRPLGEMDLTGMSLELLPVDRRFGPDRVSELITEVLPSLAGRIEVDVRSRKLPRTTKKLAPWVQLEVEQRGEHLCVLPVVVYGDPPHARIDGGRLVHLGGAVPVRDERAEHGVHARLRERLDLVPGRRVVLTGDEAVSMAARLRTWEEGVVGDAHQRCYPEQALEPRVIFDGECFDTVFELDPGDGGDAPPLTASAEQVVRAWQAGSQLVVLDGGGWAPIPVDWLERYGHRVSDLLAARGEDGKVQRAAQPAMARLCDELDHPRPAELAPLAPLIDGFEGIPTAAPPGDLGGTLRGYQQQGVDWLSFLRTMGLGAVLADDMGLGKTIQALCVLPAKGGRCLVVCPTSVVHNWAAEIERFRPGLRYELYRGPKRVLKPELDVTITSYALLRLDIDELAAQQWDVVVLDEAQAIKNPDSQVAQAAYRLQAGLRMTLSGTPVENRLEELWSLAHFTNPGLFGGRTDFKHRYADPIASGQPGVAARLRRRLRPFVLRRTKSEVAPELPPRTEAVLHCELDEHEREIYESIRLATKKNVVAELQQGGSVLRALEALLRLRQAACHAGLVPGQQAAASSKLSRLLAALEVCVAGGHKALVFSQWTSLLDRVEPELEKAELAHVRLDGSTRDRAGVVARFQDAAGPPVMLLSLKAGGTGLNLTAADHVFLLDPWWNPAAEEQAADRAHRIGQDRPVMVYRLVAKDTVEEGILALQDQKRALAAAALADADRAVGLTRDDLLALLD